MIHATTVLWALIWDLAWHFNPSCLCTTLVQERIRQLAICQHKHYLSNKNLEKTSLANHVWKDKMLNYQCQVAPLFLVRPLRPLLLHFVMGNAVDFRDLAFGLVDVFQSADHIVPLPRDLGWFIETPKGFSTA